MVQLTIDTHLRITGLPESIQGKVKGELIFDNPQYVENVKRGYSTWNVTPKLSYLWQENNEWVTNRGYTGRLIEILRQHKLEYQVADNTKVLPKVEFDFLGELKPYQQKAVDVIVKKQFGVLEAPTGSGKSVIALNIIAIREQPTLITVHTKELLYQWRDRAVQFLGLNPQEVGLIGDGQKTIGKRLTVGIINSVSRVAKTVAPHIGFVICDEVHRLVGQMWQDTIDKFSCRYMLGMSATPFRRDELDGVIFLNIGRLVYQIGNEELYQIGAIMRGKLKEKYTNFHYFYNDDYAEMIKVLTENKERNEMIISNVLTHIRDNDGIALIISDRKKHCKVMAAILEGQGINVGLVIGDSNSWQRKRVVKEANQDRIQVLICTAQLIGEGFDLKQLSSIFVTTPIKYSGRTIQCIGRILRIAEGKTQAIIYDYIDNVPMLRAMARKRLETYGKMGIKLF